MIAPTVPDTELDERLDFEPVLPCEGLDHIRGISGHHIDAPGAFVLVAPCCGHRVVQCAPRIAHFRQVGLISCGRCSIQHPIERYLIIPIDSI